MWESNPPRTLLGPAIGFEVREEHQLPRRSLVGFRQCVRASLSMRDTLVAKVIQEGGGMRPRNIQMLPEFRGTNSFVCLQIGY